MRRLDSEQRPLQFALEIMLFAILPGLICLSFLLDAYHRGILAFDAEHFLFPAARVVADGGSPYPTYGYPPLVSFAMVPFTLVPGPDIVLTLFLVPCVPLSLWLLGVRDWRCYGVVFAWAPVWAALQTANVTIFLLLGSAICWHYRDRWTIAAASSGLTVAAKLLTIPLVIWLLATRRVAAAAGMVVVAGAVSVGLWAILGFSGFSNYPSRVQTIDRVETSGSYTLQTVLEDAGVRHDPARVIWAAVAVAVLAAAVYLGWRGDDRRSFALCGTAMIVAIPVVWLHSFSFLLIPVGVMRPRLSAAWLVPILMVIGPGTGNGDPWQTAGMLVIMAVTVALALRPGAPGVRVGEALPLPSTSAAASRN